MVARFLSFLAASIALGPWALAGEAGAADPGKDLQGDPLPPGALARMGTTRMRHPDLWALCFSPDGKKLASAGGRDIRLWDAGSGTRLDVWPRVEDGPPPLWARAVAFSPDGKLLASVVIWRDSEGGPTLVVRDLASGRTPVRIRADGFGFGSVAFSPDGSRLLVAGGRSLWLGSKVTDSEGFLRLHDPSDGALVRELRGHEGVVYSAEFSSDGKTIASTSQDNTIRLWDSGTGVDLRRFAVQEEARLDGGKWLNAYRVTTAFAPDGRWIARSGSKGDIDLIEVPSGAVRHVLRGHADLVSALKFSPDSSRLASGSDDRAVRIWDVRSGQCLLELKGHRYSIRCLAFSTDGKSLASGSEDRTIQIWDAATGEPRHKLPGHRARIDDAALSPNGWGLATASPEGLLLWDIKTGRNLPPVPDLSMVSCVGYSPDGNFAAAGSWDDRLLRLYRTCGGVRPLPSTVRLLEAPGPVLSLAFSPDSQVLATCGGREGSEVVLWNVQDGQRIRSLGRLPGGADRMIFSPDGKLLAMLAGERSVFIRQLFPGGWVRDLDERRLRRVVSIAFTADSAGLITAGEGTGVSIEDGKAKYLCPRLDAIRVWKLEDASIAGQFQMFQRDPLALVRPWHREKKESVERRVTCLAVSADGALLASAEDDGKILIYETVTGKLLGELAGHGAPASHLAFTPGGKRLVSTSSEDLTSLVWDLSGILGSKR